jgi:hypothetical protein
MLMPPFPWIHTATVIPGCVRSLQYKGVASEGAAAPRLDAAREKQLLAFMHVIHDRHHVLSPAFKQRLQGCIRKELAQGLWVARHQYGLIAFRKDRDACGGLDISLD